MKNIHVLKTDKPSRLYSYKSTDLYLHSEIIDANVSNSDCNNQNIYITSDEEIKEGDCFLEKAGRQFPIKWDGKEKLNFHCKKIILTTDQDLIDLGVQVIDDEFLQWYINNPSCERVEVKTNRIVLDDVNYNFDIVDYKCKIIIPKEETKLKNICIKCGVDLYATEGRFTCQQSECRGIIVSKETLQEWADKEERKRHLIEIMKGDEELGLYDMVQHKPTQKTKLTFVEWINLLRWAGKTS